MSKVVTWIAIAVLIVGGVTSWHLIPRSWFDQLPVPGKVALVTCAIVFLLFVNLGYVLESRLLQRMFKKQR